MRIGRKGGVTPTCHYPPLSEEENYANESLNPSPDDDSDGSHNQAPSQHQYEANYSESTQEGRNNLWKEKLSLIKLQRDYIRDENTRLAGTHRIEMEKQQLELQHLRLKNHLLELEIEELKKRG
ncbi:uncharacterized protein [Drosophila pseudoobscura]|uniref:Uncharacterized protein isoform X1 n=1 Tax=Drosophila pseudoobscura pseudoobscura TaxID=46245 RepID=A0A6I8UKY9_DROPS|nr:uncharacterized protein LOC4817646 isoform X1 [Drosophila pseudoobscura]